MLVISNDCCGGRLYQQTNTQFNNPFIWMLADNDSIYYVMNNFEKINWNNYDFEKSILYPNTFIINVENKIKLHYVHYKFDPNAKSIVQEKKFDKEEHWTGDVLYCKIWEYIYKKYEERTQRMLALKEEPMFLLKEESWFNKQMKAKHTLKDIANCDSKYKRIIVTTDKTINRNDEICKSIIVNKIDHPLPTIQNNFNVIKSHFNL